MLSVEEDWARTRESDRGRGGTGSTERFGDPSLDQHPRRPGCSTDPFVPRGRMNSTVGGLTKQDQGIDYLPVFFFFSFVLFFSWLASRERRQGGGLLPFPFTGIKANFPLTIGGNALKWRDLPDVDVAGDLAVGGREPVRPSETAIEVKEKEARLSP